jgi:hypothetical protein
MSEQIKGLGDVVAKVTKVTGIEKVVKVITEKVGIEDCGCDKRREELNQSFPFKPPKNK